MTDDTTNRSSRVGITWSGGELRHVSHNPPRTDAVLQFSSYTMDATLFVTVDEARAWVRTLQAAVDWHDAAAAAGELVKYVPRTWLQ